MLELVEDKYQENIIGLSREEIGDRFLSLGLQSFVLGGFGTGYITRAQRRLKK